MLLGKKAPPDPRPAPAEDMYVAAWAITSGSWVAWSCTTDWRTSRKWGFSVKVSGVGGTAVVLPIARSMFGGEVGRRVKIDVLVLEEEGKMY